MVQFAHLAAVLVTALAGVVTADNCHGGLYYCGSVLNTKGNPIYLKYFRNYYNDIIQSLENAHQATDQAHVNDSLFYCKGPDDIPFQRFCGSGKCVNGGQDHNDSCED
ncbi:hypothetical protein PG999_012391 [Apiospora kogelbergensis]|uniref:Uncharacterized protein n=1 Tax=Apiospora kogelbergensis TaxID=1337665 RepID=A0AAW0QH17_9PEZI